ncbi:MAG: hypothetical protein EPN85_05020 [Bacteroidetes bacterium]|nr:MAG: hypothetical protein EPN85_05020 [Bacteroidota bacterium]
MTTLEKKMNLIEWLLHMEDKTILRKVERLLEYGVDKWDQLTKAQQKEIDEAIAELDKGKGIAHHAVMTKLHSR